MICVRLFSSNHVQEDVCVTVQEEQCELELRLSQLESSSLGEISSDRYRLLQCDIKKCGFDSLEMEQNCEIVDVQTIAKNTPGHLPGFPVQK